MKIEINFEYDLENSSVYPWSWHILVWDVTLPEKFSAGLSNAHQTLEEAMEAAMDARDALNSWYWQRCQGTLF